MVRTCASVALFLSLASLRLPAQSKDSETEHIRPIFSQREDVPSQPMECISKHNDKLFVSLQSGNSVAGFIMGSYARGDSRILEVNYQQAMAMPRPLLLFQLVRICESWVNTNSVPYPGHEDSLHDYPSSSADRDAIRWIRDQTLSVSWVRGNKAPGPDDNVSTISIVDSIASTISDRDRGEFLITCYRTDTSDCKPVAAQTQVPQESDPITTSIRSEEAVRHTEAAFRNYLGDADEDYRLMKERLGLSIYSASSFSTPRVLRVQAAKANRDQQVKALKDTLETLSAHCEDLGLHGMATYIFYRQKKLAEPVSKKDPQVYIAAWVHQVDDVFAKLNKASQTIAMNLTVQSDPSQNVHFTLKSRTGFIEIDTKTNSKIKNAYRGLYEYSVDWYPEPVKGWLNLIDAQGSAITCHLQSKLTHDGLIDPFCEIQ